MRARIAAATLDDTAKLNLCQVHVSASTGVLADRIEICQAWCSTETDCLHVVLSVWQFLRTLIVRSHWRTG